MPRFLLNDRILKAVDSSWRWALRQFWRKLVSLYNLNEISKSTLKRDFYAYRDWQKGNLFCTINYKAKKQHIVILPGMILLNSIPLWNQSPARNVRVNKEWESVYLPRKVELYGEFPVFQPHVYEHHDTNKSNQSPTPKINNEILLNISTQCKADRWPGYTNMNKLSSLDVGLNEMCDNQKR